MKIHWMVVSVTAYISLVTTLAAESGGYTSKVHKIHLDKAATIKEQMNGTKLAEENDRPKAIPEAPAAAAAENQVLASCSNDDSFSLSELYDGSYDGCYSEIIVSDETWFSLGGDSEDGLYFFPEEISSGYSIWNFGTVVIKDNTVVDIYYACYDGELLDVSAIHPAEITSWICASSAVDYSFVVECGCNSAPSSLPPGGALATAFLALLGANLLLVW